MPHTINRIIAFATVFCASITLIAQTPFKINQKGEVTDSSLHQLIKERGYQAVSAFDTVSNKQALVYALYFKNDKMGILDIYSKEITPAIYDEIPSLNSRYGTSCKSCALYTVKKNKKYGLITREGKEILPAKYDYIDYPRYTYLQKKQEYRMDSLFTAYLGDSVFTLNTNGKIMKVHIEESNPGDGDNDKQAASAWEPDRDENIIVNYRYGISPYEEMLPNGWFITKKQKNKEDYWGVIHKKSGKIIIPFIYNRLVIDDYGHFLAEDTLGMYGVFDPSGAVKLPFEYEWIGNQDVVILMKNKKYAVANRKYEPLTEFVYDNIHTVTDCRNENKPIILATRDGKKGVLDSLGNILASFDHDILLPECRVRSESYKIAEAHGMYSNSVNSYYFFKKDGKYGLYDTTFRVIINGYDSMGKSMIDDIVFVAEKVGGKPRWGMYNLALDSLVAPTQYDGKIKYQSGYFIVTNGGYQGVLDETGQEIFPVKEQGTFVINKVYKGLLQLRFYYSDVSVYRDYNGNRITVYIPR